MSSWKESDVIAFTSDNVSDAERFVTAFPEHKAYFSSLDDPKIQTYSISFAVKQYQWVGETTCEEDDPKLIIRNPVSSGCAGIRKDDEVIDLNCWTGTNFQYLEQDPCFVE